MELECHQQHMVAEENPLFHTRPAFLLIAELSWVGMMWLQEEKNSFHEINTKASLGDERADF